MDYGDELDHDPMSKEMSEEFVTEVSLIRTLIGEKHIINMR